jgi:transcriptional regulator with GAF, ATPase, and Fis domain
MVDIYKTIGVLAGNRTTVLVRGETGTGKEVIARAIHDHSEHFAEPFIAVNCSALTDTLLESELFGHVKGAFTGATASRKGYFELAGQGTIFLDEIGDTSPEFQTKLLRVLQERRFYPVGGESPRSTEARVIAATHQPIEEMSGGETSRSWRWPSSVGSATRHNGTCVESRTTPWRASWPTTGRATCASSRTPS